MTDSTARAIRNSLQSPNVFDSNLEIANVVDVVDRLAHATQQVARAITPPEVGMGHDAAGVAVESLTEAVMGITAGLVQIAESISELAGAIREIGGKGRT